MLLLHKESLSQTVDAICESEFEGRKIPVSEAKAAAQWIAARQGLTGAYGQTFAGFDDERKQGIVLFTGERITCASARHILGEETCRALRYLKSHDSAVQAALTRADEGLLQCLERAARDPRNTNPGLYCCGKCTIGLWRNLLTGGLDRQEERLHRGVRHLKTLRNGTGEWRKSPFWYTILALNEMDFPEAKAELHYASAKLEKTAKSSSRSGIYALRRHELAQRALQS